MPKKSFFENIKQKARSKIEAAKKERAIERESKFIAYSKAREAAKAEREKQLIQTSVFKEKLAGERRRKSLSQPSSFGSGFSDLGGFLLGEKKQVKVSSRGGFKTSYKPLTKYVKTKQGYKKVTAYKKVKIKPKKVKAEQKKDLPNLSDMI